MTLIERMEIAIGQHGGYGDLGASARDAARVMLEAIREDFKGWIEAAQNTPSKDVHSYRLALAALDNFAKENCLETDNNK